ncbi:tyrosine-type recombinase/integrase [Dyadobacter sp. 676]|uniref:Tyrosine-type recombinase/integrase n=1 Tax=Dyadobacter sp. 676 TaxID=3088362 RepID=A0AAU8FLI5_9BACT
MNDVTKPLHIYFRLKMTGNQRFIYCRISVAGTVATDFSTHVPYHPSWQQKSQLFNEQALEVHNQHLCDIKEDIRILYRELRRTMDGVTAQDIRNRYLKQRENRTLVQCLDHHLKWFKAQVGAPGFAKGTLKVHTTLDRVVRGFLNHKKRKDISLAQVRLAFGKEFVLYCRSTKQYAQNYLVRCLNYLKSIIDTAVEDGFVNANPLAHLSESKLEPAEITFITEKEIELLRKTDLLTAGQRRIADAFLLQCFTGLCYCDLKRFSPKKHIREICGVRCIQYAREKSSTLFTIPVLPYVDELIETYGENLPIISNQKMNAKLKEIAKIVGIDKHLTTHVGRKTAGTYLLNHGVRIEVVSRILGHKSIKTTETTYAALLQQTIIDSTAHLRAA